MTTHLDLKPLQDAPRLLIETDLQPIQGTRFQPTGFPDLGAATYTLHDGTEMLLVESAQSMANRLEEVCWDRATNSPIKELQGLPYIQVYIGNKFLTSSWLESHRLASAFIKDSDLNGVGMVDYFRQEFSLKKNKPLDWATIYKKIFFLDPMCLIHGVFFADKRWLGQPKVPRALSAFIEAAEVLRADSGGVKKDDISHKTVEGQKAAEGYGHVPFHRVEYTAKRITVYFHLDLKQMKAYGLSAAATDLLVALSLYKIRRWLDSDMVLRTDCKLALCEENGKINSKIPKEFLLPTTKELEEKIKDAMQTCKTELSPTPITVLWTPKPVSVELPDNLSGQITIPEILNEQCRVETKKSKGKEKKVIVFEGPMDTEDLDALTAANPGINELHKLFKKLLQTARKAYGEETAEYEDTDAAAEGKK